MDKIVIENKAHKICVNDKGDYIILNSADVRQTQGIIQMPNAIATLTSEMKEDYSNILEIHEKVIAIIDDVLGEGTCKKVFGDIVPDMGLVYDFSLQLIELAAKFSQEREKELSKKYNAQRVGNV